MCNAPPINVYTANDAQRSSMPLYELLCLARPLLPRDELQRMIQKVGGLVYSKGGVVTNVVSYGKQPLAYRIKGVQGKFDEVGAQIRPAALLPAAVWWPSAAGSMRFEGWC